MHPDEPAAGALDDRPAIHRAVPRPQWESVKNDLKAIHVAVDAKHGNRGFRFSWEVPASDENVEEVYKAVVFPAGAY